MSKRSEGRVNYLYNRSLKASNFLEENNVFSSIKKGFILIVPIAMIGAISSLLSGFPLPVVQNFIEWTGWLSKVLTILYKGSTGLISIYLVLAVSYYYSKAISGTSSFYRIIVMMVSFASFAAAFGTANGALEIEYFGTHGIFTAILCAIFSTKMFYFISERLSRSIRYYAQGASIGFQMALSSILPAILCVSVFSLFNLLLNYVFHVNNLNELIVSLFTSLFYICPDGLASVILYIFLTHFLWLFGIHGSNAILEVFFKVFMSEGSVITYSFMDVFALQGGSGGTISLVIALLLFSKYESNRQLAKTSLPYSIFNINEMILYGMPIVFNPIMAIPFLVVPVVSILIAYGFVALGLMDTGFNVGWTVPPLISGYMATSSFLGLLVQVIIIAAGVIIYVPFIKYTEYMQTERENQMLVKLINTYQDLTSGSGKSALLDRSDDVGIMARTVAAKLRQDILAQQITVYYQPQFNADQKAISAEALLRWSYSGKILPPPLVIILAQEDSTFNEMTKCILSGVCDDIIRFKKETNPDFMVSVNISPSQLNNTEYIQELIDIIKYKNVIGNIGLEVTEESSLVQLNYVTDNINLLRQNGILLAIDDFSMGQTSLKYLQNNSFGFIKIDGILVKQIAENSRCKEIIETIIHLGGRLNCQIVAEYVENEEILNELVDLGCDYFQGYYFGKAVPIDDFIIKFKDKML